MKYVPPTDKNRNSWVSEILVERLNRREEYRKAVDYYLGKHEQQLPTETDDDGNIYDYNTIINLVRITADRTTSFVFSELPELVTDPTSEKDTDEEAYLKRFFEANGGLEVLSKWCLRGFLAGHTYMRLYPSPYEGEYPVMAVLDPTTVTMFWKSNNVADVFWYEIRYWNGNQPMVEDIVRADDGKSWMVYTYEGKATKVIGMEYNHPTRHGEVGTLQLDRIRFGTNLFKLSDTYPFTSNVPPIIEVPHLPHPDSRYGLGEFRQKVLQDTINKMVGLRSKIIQENSQPVDVGTGFDPDDVSSSAGGLVTISNPNAKVSRLQLEGDLEGITSTIDKLIETYLAEARVVLLKGEAKDLQRVTNASVRTLFLDALAKNEVLRAAYGRGLRQIGKLALDMGFAAGLVKAPTEDLTITVKWPTPLPVDDVEIATINSMAVGVYMSERTAATRLNLDPKFENEAMKAEREVKNEQLTLEQNGSIIDKGAVAPKNSPDGQGKQTND